jgi:hypothetical protein
LVVLIVVKIISNRKKKGEYQKNADDLEKYLKSQNQQITYEYFRKKDFELPSAVFGRNILTIALGFLLMKFSLIFFF